MIYYQTKTVNDEYKYMKNTHKQTSPSYNLASSPVPHCDDGLYASCLICHAYQSWFVTSLSSFLQIYVLYVLLLLVVECEICKQVHV